jgi:ATP-binding protein involved in chromosome partitioning
MSVTEREILEVLQSVKYPGFTRDVVSFGVVREIVIEGDHARLRLDLGAGNPAVGDQLRRDVRAALEAMDGITTAEVKIGNAGSASGLRMVSSQSPSGPTPTAAAAAGAEQAIVPGVRHVIAVASGKGGVGKSTVAVNLALALARKGARTGLLDADIYGPSIPMMMGVDEQPHLDEGGERIRPFERYGVRFMSLGFMVPREEAVIWRGPMVMKAVEQLLRDVAWGELDVLVVDMPPGTGDAQLTLSQKVELSGAVIVTTPQDVALADAIKGVAMFQRVGVPVLGIVENMSTFLCPHCGERTDVFGHGGGHAQAKRLGVPFLGEIALDAALRDTGDRGEPIVSARPDSQSSEAFLGIAGDVMAALGDKDDPASSS